MNADDLFRPLEPPPGGAQRFAQRLEAAASTTSGVSARRRALGWAAAVGPAAALVLVAFLVREPDGPPAPTLVADSLPRPEIYESPAFDRLLGRPLRAEQPTATVDRQAASITEVDSQNQKVRIYRLE